MHETQQAAQIAQSIVEQHISVNGAAVFAAAAVKFALGALWYSPLLFGKWWSASMGMDEAKMAEAKKSALRGYILTAIGTLLMAFVTAHMVDLAHATTASAGAQTGFWLWLGYIVTFALAGVAFESKPWKLFGINIGYQFFGLTAMGAILAAWT